MLRNIPAKTKVKVNITDHEGNLVDIRGTIIASGDMSSEIQLKENLARMTVPNALIQLAEEE